MDEMENLRIEGELEKQKMVRVRGAENRDSGVADMEIIPQGTSKDGKLSPESAASANNLKRSALSNSLLDLHEQRKDCLLPGPARVYGAFLSLTPLLHPFVCKKVIKGRNIKGTVNFKIIILYLCDSTKKFHRSVLYHVFDKYLKVKD